MGDLGHALYELRRYEEALPLLQELVAILERTVGTESSEYALALQDVAAQLIEMGRHERARDILQRALAIAERLPDDDVTSFVLHTLGHVHGLMGDLEMKRALVQRSLELTRRHFGDDDPHTAASHLSLGTVLKHLGDFEGPRSLRTDGSHPREGPAADHPDWKRGLLDLGDMLKDQGDRTGATLCYDRLVTACEASVGTDHPAMADILQAVATRFRVMRDPEAAVPLQRRALAIHEAAWGAEHERVAAALDNLGWLLTNTGEHEEARSCLERALAMQERLLGRDSLRLGDTLNHLGLLSFKEGDLEGAETAVKRTLAIRERALGIDHPKLVDALGNLAVPAIPARRSDSGSPHLRARLPDQPGTSRSPEERDHSQGSLGGRTA